MALVCRVESCGRDTSWHPDGGGELGLCGTHRATLSNMCREKHRLPYAKVAVREAGRLAGRTTRAGRRPAAYRCPLCRLWHVGNEPHPASIAAASAAAAAVRAALTAEQLNQLIFAWRPQGRRRASAST